MESAHFRKFDYGTKRRRLNGARYRRVFAERQMNARAQVIGEIEIQKAPQLNTITWSKHSRRMEPFCGDPRYVAFVQTTQRLERLRGLERHITDRGSETP